MLSSHKASSCFNHFLFSALLGSQVRRNLRWAGRWRWSSLLCWMSEGSFYCSLEVWPLFPFFHLYSWNLLMLLVFLIQFNPVSLFSPFSQIINSPQSALQSLHIDIPDLWPHIGSGTTPKFLVFISGNVWDILDPNVCIWILANTKMLNCIVLHDIAQVSRWRYQMAFLINN